MAVGSTVGAIMSHSWSNQLVALVRARRTATATAPAEKPNNTAPAGRAAVMASLRAAAGSSATGQDPSGSTQGADDEIVDAEIVEEDDGTS